MRTLSTLAVLLLPTLAPAQDDTLTQLDGKVLVGKVLSMDAMEVRFKPSGSSEKILQRDKVLDLKIRSRRVLGLSGYKRAIKAEAEENWGEALDHWMKAASKAARSKGLKDFAPQFLYWQAYQLAKSQQAGDNMQEALAALAKNKEKHFYLPDLYLTDVQEAMAVKDERAALEGAKAAIQDYQKKVADADLGDRYIQYGKLYMVLIRARLKELKPAEVQTEFQKMLAANQSDYPDIANRLNLEIANSTMVAKKWTEARSLYSEIIKSPSSDSETRARARLGRGHTWFQKPGATPEDAKKALADYMRVVTLNPDGDVETVGEALYYANKAYAKWNGPNARINRGRILGKLRGKYKASSWSKKK